jgi:Flp pilus assembly protein TadB
MNRLQAAALVAVLAAGALLSTARGFGTRRRSITEVRAILLTERSGDRPAAAPDHGWARRLVDPARTGPLATSVERRIGDDLRHIGSSPQAVASRLVLAAVLGTMTVVLTTASLMAIGRLAPSPVWLLAAPLVGLTLAGVIWHDVLGRIERHRRAFHQATNDFVQLVAVGLTTDQSVEEAIRFAVDVGEGPAMAELRTALVTAPQRGLTLWEALDHLGRDQQQRELCELAASIERQGTQGVSITDTVATLATTMRAKALDDLEREADRANANLSGPTISFVVTTVVFLAYPLAIRISEAFGG